MQKDLKSWTGSFVSFSDASVALKTPEGNHGVARTEVLRVSRHGSKRGRNALIGAAAAGGAEVAIGAAAGGCNGKIGPVSEGVSWLACWEGPGRDRWWRWRCDPWE